MKQSCLKTQTIKKENVDKVMALSPMQESMIFQYLSSPPHDERNIAQFCYRVKNPINLEIFKEALKIVVHQNEMLRVVFRWRFLEQPIQIVLKEVELPLTKIDIPHQGQTDLDTYLQNEMQSERMSGFDLEKQSYRFRLYQKSNAESYFLVSCYNIIFDGWSNAIMLQEIIRTYDSLLHSRLPDLKQKSSFEEFISWLQSRKRDGEALFWRDYLRNLPPESSFVVSHEKAYSKYLSAQLQIDDNLESSIAAYLERNQVTYAAVFYAAWAILLYQYSGNTDNVFGVTFSGRPDDLPGMNEVMGLFINTIPIRVTVSYGDFLSDFVKCVYENLMKIRTFEHTPLSDVKTHAQVNYRRSLFDTLVVVQNYPLDKMLVNQQGGMAMELHSMFDQTAFTLVLGITNYQGITIDLRYDLKDFHPEKIKEIMEQYLTNIRFIVQGNRCRLDDINMSRIDINQKSANLDLLKRIDFDEVF